MKRYWNLTEKERAGMADDAVTALEKVELMENGCVPLKEPVYEKVDEVKVETHRYYRPSLVSGYAYELDFVFETEEEASLAATLHPFHLDRDYKSDTKYIGDQCAISITIVALPMKNDMERVKARMIDSQGARVRNGKMREQYDAEVEKQSNILVRMREDRNLCRGKVAVTLRVLETYDEYLRLSDGESKVAQKFLAKAYPAEQVEEAFLWHDRKDLATEAKLIREEGV